MERWRPGGLEELEQRFEDIFSRPFLPSVKRRLPIEESGWAPPI